MDLYRTLIESVTSSEESISKSNVISTRENDPYNEDASFYKDRANPVLECDYDQSANALYSAIEEKRWDDARKIFQDDNKGDAARKIEEGQKPRSVVLATTWVYRIRPGTNRLKWRINPLHASVIFDAPSDVLRLVRDAHPAAAKLCDDQGNLPLHLAFKNGLDEDRIDLLLEAYPRGMEVKNHLGLTPMECAAFCRKANRRVRTYVTTAGSGSGSMSSGSASVAGISATDSEQAIDMRALVRGDASLECASVMSASSVDPSVTDLRATIVKELEDELRDETETSWEERLTEIEEDIKRIESGEYVDKLSESWDDGEDKEGPEAEPKAGVPGDESLVDFFVEEVDSPPLSTLDDSDPEIIDMTPGFGCTPRRRKGRQLTGGDKHLHSSSSPSSKQKKKKGVLGKMKSFGSKRMTSLRHQRQQSQIQLEDVPEEEDASTDDDGSMDVSVGNSVPLTGVAKLEEISEQRSTRGKGRDDNDMIMAFLSDPDENETAEGGGEGREGDGAAPPAEGNWEKISAAPLALLENEEESDKDSTPSQPSMLSTILECSSSQELSRAASSSLDGAAQQAPKQSSFNVMKEIDSGTEWKEKQEGKEEEDNTNHRATKVTLTLSDGGDTDTDPIPEGSINISAAMGDDAEAGTAAAYNAVLVEADPTLMPPVPTIDTTEEGSTLTDMSPISTDTERMRKYASGGSSTSVTVFCAGVPFFF